MSLIPAYLEQCAFREWEEQGHTLQWYAIGEVAAQLLTEAVLLYNLQKEIRLHSTVKHLTIVESAIVRAIESVAMEKNPNHQQTHHKMPVNNN